MGEVRSSLRALPAVCGNIDNLRHPVWHAAVEVTVTGSESWGPLRCRFQFGVPWEREGMGCVLEWLVDGETSLQFGLGLE